MIMKIIKSAAIFLFIVAALYMQQVRPVHDRKVLANSAFQELSKHGAQIFSIENQKSLSYPLSFIIDVPLIITSILVPGGPPVVGSEFVAQWFVIKSHLSSFDEKTMLAPSEWGVISANCQAKKYSIIDKENYASMYDKESLGGKAGVYGVLGEPLKPHWDDFEGVEDILRASSHFPMRVRAEIGVRDIKLYGDILHKMCTGDRAVNQPVFFR